MQQGEHTAACICMQCQALDKLGKFPLRTFCERWMPSWLESASKMPDEKRCTAARASAGRSRSAAATLHVAQMLLRQAASRADIVHWAAFAAMGLPAK